MAEMNLARHPSDPGPVYSGLAFAPDQPILALADRIHAKGRFADQMRMRATILANARSLCGEVGIAGVHIRDLARRSGVSPPTIYNNLGSRHDVLRRAISESMDAKLELARQFSERSTIAFPLAYALVTWETLACDRGYYRSVIRSSLRNEVGFPVAMDCISRMVTSHRHALYAMQSQGQLRDSNLSIERAASIMAIQNTSVTNGWALSETNNESLRTELVYGAALPLLALATKDTIVEIESFVSTWC